MRSVRLKDLEAETVLRIKQRAAGAFEGVNDRAQSIMDEVKKRGDAAIREFTAKLDGVNLDTFEVTPAELEEALKQADPALLDAMRHVIANLTKFHSTHVKLEEEHVYTDEGIELWRVWRPIERVGL